MEREEKTDFELNIFEWIGLDSINECLDIELEIQNKDHLATDITYKLRDFREDGTVLIEATYVPWKDD